jgi:hypothetical protein
MGQPAGTRHASEVTEVADDPLVHTIADRLPKSHHPCVVLLHQRRDAPGSLLHQPLLDFGQQRTGNDLFPVVGMNGQPSNAPMGSDERRLAGGRLPEESLSHRFPGLGRLTAGVMGDTTGGQRPGSFWRATMKIPQPGNGSGKFDVGTHDMGGWVRVFASQSGQHVEDLAFYLAHRLSLWFRENPHQRLICVVPISKGGNTVELHGWYEQHIFPDTSPLARPQGE